MGVGVHWSLLGVKTPKPLTDEKSMAANYSNEGGVGYNRYQKTHDVELVVSTARVGLQLPDGVPVAQGQGAVGTAEVVPRCLRLFVGLTPTPAPPSPAAFRPRGITPAGPAPPRS